MDNSAFTKFGCFTHWWAALPAVPPDPLAIDWWAPGNDGRTSRYERLKRVWFDTTRFLSPKHDPCRPHEFANPRHGTHLTCKTWESFVLFDPSEWIPMLLKIAGMATPFEMIDCAWCYEFEAMVGETRRFKLADIVLYGRGCEGQELLLVVEVKKPGDKLKKGGELPDTEPSSYLDREAFLGIADRRLIYLTDSKYAPVVKAKVNTADNRWSVLTWDQLARIQFTLAAVSFPEPLLGLILTTLATQFLDQQITGLIFPDIVTNLARARDEYIRGKLPEWRNVPSRPDIPSHLREYAAGAVQHLTCLTGNRPARPAFDYLAAEISFEQLNSLPSHERQRTVDRRRSLWRLPPASH